MSYKFRVRGGLRVRVSVDHAMRKLYLLGGHQTTRALQGSRSAWSGTLSVDSGSHSFDEIYAALLATGAYVEVEVGEPAPEEVEERVLDTSVLDQSVKKLTAALKTGEYDEVLSELIEAERDGQDRKSAVQALEARIALA